MQPAYDGESHSAVSKLYGFVRCVNQARGGQSLAINLADTYAKFATALYRDKWDWSSEFAANS